MEGTATLHSFDESSQQESKKNCLFRDLPNEVGLQCLARVPRSCYRSLSRVCKLWQYHISSQALYSTRKALNIIDFSICLVISLDSCLRHKNCPYLVDSFTKIHELFPLSSSTGNARDLFKIPSRPSIPPSGAAIVSVGSNIYAIGGFGSGRTMWVYNLVSNKWALAKPQMQVARMDATAWGVNGKIYVIGGLCSSSLCSSSENLPLNWAEVFDLETKKWSPIPSPTPYEVSKEMLYWNAVAEGKIMYFDVKMSGFSGLVMVFDTGSGEWTQLQTKLNMISVDYMETRPVVISGVLYLIDYQGRKISGYDFDVQELKNVGGMEGMFPKFIHIERLVNMGGRLVIVWLKRHFERRALVGKLYVTVISVQKNNDGKLWGSVFWNGLLGKLPTEDCVVVGF